MKVQSPTSETTTPNTNKKEIKSRGYGSRKNKGQENDCNCQTPNTNRKKTRRRNRRRKGKERLESDCNSQLQQLNSDKSDTSDDDADSSFDSKRAIEAQQDLVRVFTQEFVREALATAIANLQSSPQQNNNESPRHSNLKETQQTDYNLQPKSGSSKNNGAVADDDFKEASEAEDGVEMYTSQVGQVAVTEHLQPSSEQRNNQNDSSDISRTNPKTGKVLSFFRKLFG